VTFWQKGIGEKSPNKMLMKLTPGEGKKLSSGVNFIFRAKVFCAAFL